MVKEQGTFEKLSKSGPLFQKLMENAGKMEEKIHDKEENSINDKDKVLLANNEAVVLIPNDASYSKKGKLRKSTIIKQEERETGVVSWKVLMRYDPRGTHDIGINTCFPLSWYYHENMNKRDFDGWMIWNAGNEIISSKNW